MTQTDVLLFIKNHIHAVISTVDSQDQPKAALIGFGETDELEIIFGTYSTSRKYKNLSANPKVALVIGWERDNITVQYEGIARELPRSEWGPYLDQYHKKVPSAAKFISHPDQTYFLVKPTWIRYSDLSGTEELTFEFKL